MKVKKSIIFYSCEGICFLILFYNLKSTLNWINIVLSVTLTINFSLGKSRFWCQKGGLTKLYYSFERDILNQSNATFTSKTLFSFLRDLSPLAYSCLLTKLKIKYSIRHVFISSRLGSYFWKNSWLQSQV